MSGTGAIRQFVSKAVRLGSRAAFGHPSLALGQPLSPSTTRLWNEHACILAGCPRVTADAVDALGRG
jgi:hypothetical protein